ncbi:HTH-type transcriptional regulator GltR [Paraburkholderia nemoris]|uniref:LysR substrate-binding domain-containing protein n=1 Tax=Paraburkholderia nemoris TaxID=2793076 RepID=UPI00190CC21F|nr:MULTISPECIES: LysR substrate-binding domain-containing protein [Paraburkholderia]MBK3787037.1 LysR family transcriptional regulator [Paraburkholderia aspalathi]CAE6866106.1 HTH-type transcriptional regulator GltR [Paraburkholderia nemoris]
MDLQSLKIFKAVAEEGGIARAAKVLNCVQSNVSTRLKQFEGRLGIQLFYRLNGRLVITNEGSQLLGYADRMLQLAEEVQSILKNGGEPAGKLRIGSTEVIAAARLPSILADFHRRYPRVDMAIKTSSVEHVIHAVTGHRLDIALVPAPVISDDLDQDDAFEEELVLVSDHGHSNITSVEDVIGSTYLALSAGCAYRARYERWLGETGFRAGNVVELSTSELIIACAGAGMGISLMPKSLVERWELAGVVRSHAIASDVARAKTLFVWPTGIAQHTARDAFVQFIRDQGVRMQ